MIKHLLTLFLLSVILPCGNASAASLIAGPSEDDEIIENPLPELQRETYSKRGWGWTFNGSQLVSQDSRGSATQMVKDGETVYLSNPVSLAGVPGWVKGTIEGNRITLQLPQYVQYREVVTPIGQKNEYYKDYLLALDLGEDEEGAWYFPSPEQKYVLIIQEDGSLLPEDDTVMLGICLWVNPAEFGDTEEEPQWDWIGTGDLYWELTPVTEEICQVPASVEMKDWNLVYNTTYFPVKVGFDGDDCYITGLCNIDEAMSDRAVKGTVAEDKIIFPTGQYFGISPRYKDVIYFMTGDSHLETDNEGAEFRKFDKNEAMVFDYDKTMHLMTTQDDYCTSVTMSDPYYYSFVLNPAIRINNPDEIVTNLLTPIYYDFYSQNDEYGFPNQILFILPDISADFQPLDKENIFYQVFVEGDLFTFYPDEYTAIKEEMTDVPYGFNDNWDFYGNGALQYVYVAPLDIEELSVRSGYHNVDGSTVYSDMLYFIGEPKVSVDAPSDFSPVDTHYFDFRGNRLQAPISGEPCIRLERFSDGSGKATKLIRR